MKILLIVFMVMASCVLAPFIQAKGINLSVAPVWWQYKESSNKQVNIPDSPLNSSAQGYGVELALDSLFVFQEDWDIKLGVKTLLPVIAAKERWNLATGLQTNQLHISQSELRLDAAYHLGALSPSLWSSYQFHYQSRKNFVVNGVAKNISNITETVQVGWIGAALDSSSNNDFTHIHIEAGLPVWVHTTNSALKGSFSKRSGYRLGARFSMKLPWNIQQSGLRLYSDYQFKQLGNELIAEGLWPKNRWQSLLLGINATW